MTSNARSKALFRRQRAVLLLKNASTSVSFPAIFHGACALLVFLGAMCTSSANAVTITFKETPQEGPVTASLDLTDCSNCIKVAETGGNETGVVSFTAPPGVFVFNLPSGVTQAEALLIDPPAIPGGTSIVSDRVLLEINNTPQLISITANFQSDSDNVTVFPEFGALPESGGIQDMSNAFAKIVPGGVHPAFVLPANLIIKAQSEIDIVPEPSIGVLLGCGLLVFVARSFKRDY
jgi:hypothetical protein